MQIAGDIDRIETWMLSKIIDSNGNFVYYHYENDKGKVYPTAITYGSQLFRALFPYE